MITMETQCTCIVPIPTAGVGETVLRCGTSIEVGCKVLYNFCLNESCYYRVFDNDGVVVNEYTYEPSSDNGMFGGGILITEQYSRIIFSANISLSKVFTLRVYDIIAMAESLEDLHTILESYSIVGEAAQQIADLYIDAKGGGGSYILPIANAGTLGGVKIGTNLLVSMDGKVSVDTTRRIEAGNSKPVTSEAVAAGLQEVRELIVAIPFEDYEAGTWTAPEGAIVVVLEAVT